MSELMMRIKRCIHDGQLAWEDYHHGSQVEVDYAAFMYGVSKMELCRHLIETSNGPGYELLSMEEAIDIADELIKKCFETEVTP